MIKKYYIVSCLILLAACDDVPPSAYANRGDPERMLTMSTDMVNIDLVSADSLSKLSTELTQNPPDRAVLNCDAGNKLCKRAIAIVNLHNIAMEQTDKADNTVALVYERILARDCEQHYVDNHYNNANLNYPSLGCSVRGNTVQMVTNKKQFTDPNLLDFMDGEKAGQNYAIYSAPPATAGTSNGGLSSSLISSGVSQ